MKLSELKKIIDGYFERHRLERLEPLEVVVTLASPSVGFVASSQVTGAQIGLDWDSGTFLITTEDRLVKKTKYEDAFDSSRDLLMYLATKPSKRESYETRTAKAILKSVGYTDEEFTKYQHFFHPKAL